tara:strand:+ start:5120 stop:5989 length:870 start_codon:yes stop_codon:yes gene_type:complete
MTEDTGSVDAGNPAEAPAEAPVAAPVAAPQAPAPWIDSVADADTRTWAESKGLQNGSFENVLGSYRNLEKMMGAEKAGNTVTLLGDDATPEQMGEYYSKLGRPDDASGYNFTPPEGESADFSNWASGVFHKAGLSAAQASMIQGEWDSYVGASKQGEADATHAQNVDASAQLKKDWGAAYDQNMMQLDNFATQLGMSDNHLVSLRDAMGGAGAAQFIHSLGQRMGEDTVDTGEALVGGALTPDQARVALQDLNMNDEFMTAWLNKNHPGHNAAVEKKASLARQMSGAAA